MTSSTPSGSVDSSLLQNGSPPPSLAYDERPVIQTDDQGMVVDDEESSSQPSRVRTVKQKRLTRQKRRTFKYVSRHFTEEPPQSVAIEPPEAIVKRAEYTPSTPPVTPAKATTPMNTTLPKDKFDIDGLSSDSSLTDVPDDFGPDPFSPTSDTTQSQHELAAIKTKKSKRNPSKSPYFPHPHKYRPTFLSTLPFPPLSAPRFGLMQERLAHDPFRLLIATIFLNKTPGERAMPVFYQLMEKYPTPEILAAANVADVTAIIHHLGFQNQRARKCVSMAQMWVEREPANGKRCRKLNYPAKGDGRDLKLDEVVDDDDARVAWEISHLPGLGPYSHDSWRMFCRDKLRGVADSWLGEQAAEGFEPEWKRVLPTDKELRAYLTWMWLKEGWIWNKETGERTRADDALMERARGGGVVLEEREKDVLTIQTTQHSSPDGDIFRNRVEKTAGEFLDRAVVENRIGEDLIG